MSITLIVADPTGRSYSGASGGRGTDPIFCRPGHSWVCFNAQFQDGIRVPIAADDADGSIYLLFSSQSALIDGDPAVSMVSKNRALKTKLIKTAMRNQK
jgi:hypothetical protein